MQKPSQRQTGESDSAYGALDTDLTNQQIGRYLIQRRLGSGGTAVVYQAYDQVRGRSVALKVLASTADEKMLIRFRREAMTSGALHHPNIVRTLQVGVAPHGDVAYIAMELVEGESLSALLDRCGYLDSDEAAALIAPIATALAHAHENGIIHRDVKPSNILLQPSGSGNKSGVYIDVLDYPVVPMLSDFGIARSLDSPELTNLGRTVGTPAYMAPEQCAGQRDIDGRADVYSLGAVLYRCVVGRQPFLGATPQILHAHVYDPLTIDDEILRRLPPLVVELLIRSMAKKSSGRYASAGEMALALAEAGGYDIVAPLAVSEPTATITLDNLPASSGSSSAAASILVPGLVPLSETTTTQALSSAGRQPASGQRKTPSNLSQYDLDGLGTYSQEENRPPSSWQWSSLALLFVGVLVGASTALFMSGTFDRLPFFATGDATLVSTATPTSTLSISGVNAESLTATVVQTEIKQPAAMLTTVSTLAPSTDTPVDSTPGATFLLTLVPSETPLVTLTNAPTKTPLITPTVLPTASPTSTSTALSTATLTATVTSSPTTAPTISPSPTWTPPAPPTSGTTTLPPTLTPTQAEAPNLTPQPTVSPPTPTWTPATQSNK